MRKALESGLTRAPPTRGSGHAASPSQRRCPSRLPSYRRGPCCPSLSALPLSLRQVRLSPVPPLPYAGVLVRPSLQPPVPARLPCRAALVLSARYPTGGQDIPARPKSVPTSRIRRGAFHRSPPRRRRQRATPI